MGMPGLKVFAALVVGAVCWTSPSMADETLPANVFELSLFAAEGVHYEFSDVQGDLAAGGDVSLLHFGLGTMLPRDVPARLIAGGDLRLSHGSVRGSTWLLGTLRGVDHAAFGGVVYYAGGTPEFDRSSTSLYLEAMEQRAVFARLLIQYAEDAHSAARAVRDRASQAPFGVRMGQTMVLPETGEVTVYRIQSSEFEGLSRLVLQGRAETIFLIDVLGSGDLEIAHLDVALEGILPANVLISMSGIRRLNIHHTSDPDLGLGATILAPEADVEFSAGLLTGSLIARSIRAGRGEGEPGGQINRRLFSRPDLFF